MPMSAVDPDSKLDRRQAEADDMGGEIDARGFQFLAERAGVGLAGLDAVGDEDHQRPVAIRSSGQDASGLERHADTECVVRRARALAARPPAYDTSIPHSREISRTALPSPLRTP